MEETRIPHFLYIDEFTPFIEDSTMDMFTLYRKYRVGPIVSAQNLAQMGKPDNSYRQTILANSTTKFVFGNNTPEDNDWWNLEFGDKREWVWTSDYHTDKGRSIKQMGNDDKVADEYTGATYDENYKSIKYAWVKNYAAGKIQALKYKQVIYKTKDLKGKNLVGKAKLDFLESRYKEPQKIKKFNFGKFVKAISGDEEDKEKKFDFTNIDFSKSASEDPNRDGPIARNPNRTFEYNRVGSNYVNPIKTSDKPLSEAIDDYNKHTKKNK